jgi:hypothetical protein
MSGKGTKQKATWQIAGRAYRLREMRNARIVGECLSETFGRPAKPDQKSDCIAIDLEK